MINLKTPVSAFIEVTSNCNLQCKHCYNNSYKLNINELTSNQLEILSKQIINLKIVSVTISGGEPLLCSSIYDFILSLTENNVKVSLNTNGILLTEKVLEKLTKCGIYSIQVSIDGDEKIHDYIRGNGSYFLTKKNIESTLKYGLSVKIGYTINSLNWQSVENVCDEFFALGCGSFAFYRYVPSSKRDVDKKLILDSQTLFRISEMLEKLRKKYLRKNKIIYFEPLSFFSFIINKKYIPHSKCLMGKGQITINNRTVILACAHFRKSFGDVYNIADSWKNIQEYFSSISNSLPKDCMMCPYVHFCRGGCPGIVQASGLVPFVNRDPACFFEIYETSYLK